MKTILLLLFIPFCLTSQTTESIINEVNLDSLVQNINILTGVIPILNGISIPERKSVEGRQLSATFLEKKLKEYGLVTNIDNYRLGGNNVIGFQEGTKYPDSSFIISAHYDAVAEYCADDDASGTSAVLEAARILSQYQFDYSIIYALWDEEELGLIGSRNYADKAAENNENIVGNLNMDMIGYDGNDDGLFEVHLNNTGLTRRLHDVLKFTYEENEFDSDLFLFTAEKGVTNSDHSSFWRKGYGAILITEAYTNNDFNPDYHKASDRITGFNLDYYHNVSKLTIATLSELAVLSKSTSILEKYNNNISIYPNPVVDYINLPGIDSPIISLEIIDITGRTLDITKELSVNKINVEKVPNGLYSLIARTSERQFISKFIKIQ